MTLATATLDVLRRNNVQESGVVTGRPILFAHGFGCSQDMWRLVAPHFERDHRVITFEDIIAPSPVGEFVHANIAGSTLVVVPTNGHCLNLSHPIELVAAMRSYLK